MEPVLNAAAHEELVDTPPVDSSIRVLLADDHDFVRRSLRRLIDREAEFALVGEADNAPSLRRHLAAQQPHVLVLDVNLPGGSPLVALRALRDEAPDTAIVVTTMVDDARFAREALTAGACGYVLKDAADDELGDAVRCAARGDSYVSPSVASALAAYDRCGRDKLSDREIDVLRLIALGHTNAEIAETLGISIRTVETHRAHIHRKLRLGSRAQLVDYALKRGLLDEFLPSSVGAA